MKKVVPIFLLLLFILLLDRFFFLPGRMDGEWEYVSGNYMGDTITFDNITIQNNFEIQITANRNLDSYYLIGCYFGRLYLMDKNTLKYTEYSKF